VNAALRSLVWLTLLLGPALAVAQANPDKPAADKAAATPVAELEQQVFDVLRQGDALKFLSYVAEDGVNIGRDAEHATRDAVAEQLAQRKGLYCKLFDSACLQSSGEDKASAQSCSYRELLTQSEKVRMASTETKRNGVRQAILVAQVQNQKCGGAVLIDFIFNYQKGGWKLFSIP
jgi:hypothetical protein